jgi:hypothetical protein
MFVVVRFSRSNMSSHDRQKKVRTKSTVLTLKNRDTVAKKLRRQQYIIKKDVLIK